jgi:hypothetical protein
VHSPRSSKGRRKSVEPQSLSNLQQSKHQSRYFPDGGGGGDDGGELSPACPDQLDSPSLANIEASPTSASPLNPAAATFVPAGSPKKNIGKPPTPKKRREAHVLPGPGGGSSPQKTRSRPGTPMRQHEASSVVAGDVKSEASAGPRFAFVLCSVEDAAVIAVK